MTRLPTPPGQTPPLILCADGGGSKVCVVIRSADGVEVRGTAGPCNVQSVGYSTASQRILLATYRALSLLPATHLPAILHIPPLPPASSTTRASATNSPSFSAGSATVSRSLAVRIIPTSIPINSVGLTPLPISAPATPHPSRPGSPTKLAKPAFLPPLPGGVFQYIWLALAGISTESDSKAFMPYVKKDLCMGMERIKITNDVNLLAAPALGIPGVKHAVAVVCGTGTVGRTIRVDQASSSAAPIDVVMSEPNKKGTLRALPLEDVGVSRGWGYMLCDEGSAFWLGRLAIRSLLHHADRLASTQIHSGSSPEMLPLHRDLLLYFDTPDPMDLIEICTLTGAWADGLDAGEATAKRNAVVAGAARVVFRHAFPEDEASPGLPPSPPASLSPMSSPYSTSKDSAVLDDPILQSHQEALKLAKRSVVPMIELTMDLLGDQSVVKPEESVLALGGGLMMSDGYRGLLLDGLRKEGVRFREERVVGDAAGVGARGLAGVEFGI